MSQHWVSPSCGGEKCGPCSRAGKATDATHKIGEEFLYDPDRPAFSAGFVEAMCYDQRQADPYRVQSRHNLTQYVCCRHFVEIMGPLAAEWCGVKRAIAPGDRVRIGALETVVIEGKPSHPGMIRTEYGDFAEHIVERVDRAEENENR
jgi:hypothetical protein